MKNGLHNKSQLLGTLLEGVVEDVGVEVKEEANVGVEVMAEDQEIMVKEIVVKEVVVKGIKVKERILIVAIKLNVILTNLHSRPVSVTGPLARVHTFVWSQPPVLGRTFLCPSPINEANSTKKMT